MRRIVLASAIAAVLSGCATQPLPTSEAKPVSTRAVLNNQFTTPRPGTGRIVVKRDTGIMGAACTYRIYANGSPVVDLRASEAFEFHLPAGTHIVGARPASLCGGGTSEVQVIINEGRTSTYRLASGQMGDIVLQPTAF